MSTKTNGILTKGDIDSMGLIDAFTDTSECVTFGDLYNTPVSNVRMSDASISTDRTKLVRNDKIVKHFVKQNGKVTINFTNNTGKGLALGDFDIIITSPTTFRVPKTTDWANTGNNNYVSFTVSALTVSGTVSNWVGGGSSFDSFGNGTTISVSKTIEAWFFVNPSLAAGKYSIVFDNVSNTNLRFVNGATIFQYTTGTNRGYKHTYQVNNSSLVGTYNAFKNQTLTINISVESE